VEAHAEQEWARGMNLNDRLVSGVDFDGGHADGVDLKGEGGRHDTDVEVLSVTQRRSGR
jgi:hypothetical protein